MGGPSGNVPAANPFGVVVRRGGGNVALQSRTGAAVPQVEMPRVDYSDLDPYSMDFDYGRRAQAQQAPQNQQQGQYQQYQQPPANPYSQHQY